MSRIIDLKGKRVGRLMVLRRGENTAQGQPQWHCICDCGCFTLVRGDLLRNEKTKSCGCLKAEMLKSGMFKTHGASKSRLYSVWQTMKKRVFDKNRKDYKHYGGRGIKICDEWVNSFDSFYGWAISSGYSPELTIDRISNDEDYSPNNCRWVDMSTQANNKRNNRRVAVNGENKTHMEWAREIGGNATIIRDRIERLGWSAEKAITTPVKKQKKVV